MELSVQMYSLRGEVEREGLAAVLGTIRRAGFSGVELAGFYGMDAGALAEQIKAAGLRATGMHVSIDDLADTDKLTADAGALGLRDVIIAWMDEARRADLPATLRRIETAADRLDGLRLGYHNHDFEFDPKYGDILGELSKVGKLYFEPDIFWFAAAGADAQKFFAANAARIMAVHLKELSPLGKDDFNPLPGRGAAGCAEAVRFAKKENHAYIVLEAEKLNVPYGEYLQETARFVRAVTEA